MRANELTEIAAAGTLLLLAAVSPALADGRERQPLEIPHYTPPSATNPGNGIFADSDQPAQREDGAGGFPSSPLTTQPAPQRQGAGGNGDPAGFMPNDPPAGGDGGAFGAGDGHAGPLDGIPDGGGPDDGPLGDDCNGNGIDDALEIMADPSLDMNLDGAIDRCTLSGDLNHDGAIDVLDLVDLILAWGACADEGDCHGDLTADALVNEDDILVLMAHWE